LEFSPSFFVDYVVNWNIPHKPVQGGFLVLRPDKAAYNEYIEIVLKGDFREGYGWGGAGVGPFYGAMTGKCEFTAAKKPYTYEVPLNIVHSNDSARFAALLLRCSTS
jgi:hypothetical protein